MNPLKLSICIPVYNNYNFTAACLKDLAYLDRTTHEVIVVDNGSSDDTQKGMQGWVEKHNNVKYYRLEENTGFAYASNLAFSKAAHPLIMFLNNDIRVFAKLPNWTEPYIMALQESPKSLIGPTGGFVNPTKDFHFSYETDGDKKFNYLSGWMLLGTKDIFKSLIVGNNLGPFDAERYKSYYEDTDLSFRAIEAGYNLNILTNNAVSHFGKMTSKKLNMKEMYSTSRIIFSNIWSKK